MAVNLSKNTTTVCVLCSSPVRTGSEISERNEKSRVETLSSVFHILPPIIISSIKVFSTPSPQSNNIQANNNTKLCLNLGVRLIFKCMSCGFVCGSSMSIDISAIDLLAALNRWALNEWTAHFLNILDCLFPSIFFFFLLTASNLDVLVVFRKWKTLPVK